MDLSTPLAPGGATTPGIARIRVNGGPWRRVMPGLSLLGAIRGRAGVPIHTHCGLGSCGSDMVLVHAGGQCLSPVSASEARTLAAEGAPENARLACVTRLEYGDVEVEVPPASLEPSTTGATAR